MARYPSKVPQVLAPVLEEGERLDAATFAENRTDAQDIIASITGGTGAKLARDEKAPQRERPGLAGTIFPGEVLVAVTATRVLVFPRRGPQVFTPPVELAPDDLAGFRWSSRVIGSQLLEIEFADTSWIHLGLPTNNHGKQVARAVAHLCGWPEMSATGALRFL